MKKLLLFSISLLFIISIKSQTKVRLDSNGNYISANYRKKVTLTKSEKIYTDNDNKQYSVYINSNNRPFIIRKSKKTGKEYKQYLDVTF